MAARHGYAGKILRVDLSSGNITCMSTKEYCDGFLGGRGIAARIYWDEVSSEVSALEPENKLIFMTGPLAGLPGLAGSRWTVCGKSPTTIPEHFSYTNLGGSWGAQLKFAGYDGIVIQGRSDNPVYLFIQDDVAEIRDASSLWGRSTMEARDSLKGDLGSSVRVVACGPAGENLVAFAGVLADNDSSGSNGFGAVMGSKNLKAVAVKGSGKLTAAKPERLTELRKHIRELKSALPNLSWDEPRHWYDDRPLMGNPKLKRDVCYGCISGCIRAIREAKDGRRHKFFCGSAVYYHDWAVRYYGEVNEVPFYATMLVDGYGLDAFTIQTTIMWLTRCYKAGILTDENTGIPISKIGSLEFIETLLRKIALREGFGVILAQGLSKAADSVGRETSGFITDFVSRGNRVLAYDPRMFNVHALLYAMEPTLPIQQLHEISFPLYEWMRWVNNIEGSYLSSDVFRAIAKRFWGSELAGDFSTYEGKALAAVKIQDRENVKESLIFCDVLWPIIYVAHSRDHVGDPSLESQVLSAVTGEEIDEEGLYRVGERIFNLQRAILVREGHHGRKSDILAEHLHIKPLKFAMPDNPECLVPGKDGKVVSVKGAVVDREKFERMKDEYYQLRGWDVVTGLQTRKQLAALGLGTVAENLEQRGLIAVV
jgi:aldehyde:ferredoxin oxidoreductase